VPTLSERIAAIIQTVGRLAPNAEIVVTGYPVLFGQFAGTCSVGLLNIPESGIREQLTYSYPQAAAVDEAVRGANALIADGVLLSGDPDAHYVDVNDVPEGFVGHGLCDGGDRWISGLFPATAQPRDRGFHPNPAGQRAYADIMAPVIAAALAG
jgi:hypothetical protein